MAILSNRAKNLFGFLVAFAMIFVTTYAFLAFVGATPDPFEEESTSQTPVAQAPENKELPVRIVAKSIGLDQKIVNPASTEVEVLDQALENGAVRYPTSAMLGENGTVALFGHSSYLPVVYHQYYKTFNGIQNLQPGQTVSVYSGDTEYRYSVANVRIADANEDVVELPTDAKYLALWTCDSFAKKTNRFVVTANFVGAYPISN